MADELRRQRWFWAGFFTTAYGLVLAAAVAAVSSLEAHGPWNWGRFWLIFFAVPAAGLLWRLSQALDRRTSPQAGQRYAVDDETRHAMRTGVLPPDADPEKWRARIRDIVLEAYVAAALVGILCISAAVLTAVAAHEQNHDDEALWALAVLALILVGPLFWMVRRVQRRRQGLLARF